MKKCFKCNSDMIYLGSHEGPIKIGPVYNYVCINCHQIEWSTAKEKSKYKWYKFDKEELKKILELEEGVK